MWELRERGYYIKWNGYSVQWTNTETRTINTVICIDSWREKKRKRKKKRILPFHNFHRHVQPTDLKRAGAARLVVSHNTYMESFNDACLIATHRGREGDWLLEESALLEQSFERARGNECNRSCHSIWPKAVRRRNGNVKIALKISSWRGFAPSTRLQKPRSCVTSAAGVMNAEPRH